MKVSLDLNPKNPNGFSIRFPYNKAHVEKIKQVLSTSFDKQNTAWVTNGPEALLDMQRFGIEVQWISGPARVVAEKFRQQLWDVMDARVAEYDEEFGYQRQGSSILAAMPNIILGDDMGLGKSKQSLDAAAHIGADFILVLCPKTLCYNWKNEVEKWHPEWRVGVVPDEKRDTYRGKGRDRQLVKEGRESFWATPPNVVIANYEKLLMNDWPIQLDWDCLICDEATRLKNSSGVTHKKVKMIVKKTKCTWALTGTPLEIKLVELYNILGLLRPAVLGNYMRFRDQHLITDWAGSVVGAKNMELLRERIAPFMLRRTKREVLTQLPGKMPVNNVFIKLSNEEERAYEMMKDEFNNWLSEHGVSGAGNPITEVLRMRQFTCTPHLFTDELGRGSKFEMLQEIVEGWEDQMIVFCSFEQVTQRLLSWLNCHPDAYIAGPVNVEERFKRIEAFNRGELGKVLISTDAGGMGLNITGANMVVHYDQLWNPQRMNQRVDRADRIGQTKKVFEVNLLCLDTIDVGMYQHNLELRQLFNEVVDGAEEAILRKLDAPRWRRMIEGRLNNERIE